MIDRKVMLKNELYYSEFATFDKDALRLKQITKDIRPCFFRDIDRIIHTHSYTRYMDKTQVYSFKDNDHITKRMLHVQLVSKIARTIGRALSLNEDLIEAIALGHDLGHIPYGHVGEEILNIISIDNNEGFFMHNVQSVRNLMVLEDVNLTYQVLDGILCHNGEFALQKYYPKKKNIDDFLKDYNKCYQDNEHADLLRASTLEGCVVRVSDIIGYLGRDIEDAIELNMFDKALIPDEIKNVLGTTNSEIINTVILDIINNSLNKDYLKISDDVYNAIVNLKKFNYKNIYLKANTNEDLIKYKEMFEMVFYSNVYILEQNLTKYNIYKLFINKLNNNYKQNNSNARIVIDYISGMTDDYFIREYNTLKKHQLI